MDDIPLLPDDFSDEGIAKFLQDVIGENIDEEFIEELRSTNADILDECLRLIPGQTTPSGSRRGSIESESQGSRQVDKEFEITSKQQQDEEPSPSTSKQFSKQSEKTRERTKGSQESYQRDSKSKSSSKDRNRIKQDPEPELPRITQPRGNTSLVKFYPTSKLPAGKPVLRLFDLRKMEKIFPQGVPPHLLLTARLLEQIRRLESKVRTKEAYQKIELYQKSSQSHSNKKVQEIPMQKSEKVVNKERERKEKRNESRNAAVLSTIAKELGNKAGSSQKDHKHSHPRRKEDTESKAYRKEDADSKAHRKENADLKAHRKEEKESQSHRKEDTESKAHRKEGKESKAHRKEGKESKAHRNVDAELKSHRKEDRKSASRRKEVQDSPPKESRGSEKPSKKVETPKPKAFSASDIKIINIFSTTSKKETKTSEKISEKDDVIISAEPEIHEAEPQIAKPMSEADEEEAILKAPENSKVPAPTTSMPSVDEIETQTESEEVPPTESVDHQAEAASRQTESEASPTESNIHQTEANIPPIESEVILTESEAHATTEQEVIQSEAVETEKVEVKATDGLLREDEVEDKRIGSADVVDKVDPLNNNDPINPSMDTPEEQTETNASLLKSDDQELVTESESSKPPVIQSSSEDAINTKNELSVDESNQAKLEASISNIEAEPMFDGDDIPSPPPTPGGSPPPTPGASFPDETDQTKGHLSTDEAELHSSPGKASPARDSNSSEKSSRKKSSSPERVPIKRRNIPIIESSSEDEDKSSGSSSDSDSALGRKKSTKSSDEETIRRKGTIERKRDQVDSKSKKFVRFETERKRKLGEKKREAKPNKETDLDAILRDKPLTGSFRIPKKATPSRKIKVPIAPLARTHVPKESLKFERCRKIPEKDEKDRDFHRNRDFKKNFNKSEDRNSENPNKESFRNMYKTSDGELKFLNRDGTEQQKVEDLFDEPKKVVRREPSAFEVDELDEPPPPPPLWANDNDMDMDEPSAEVATTAAVEGGDGDGVGDVGGGGGARVRGGLFDSASSSSRSNSGDEAEASPAVAQSDNFSNSTKAVEPPAPVGETKIKQEPDLEYDPNTPIQEPQSMLVNGAVFLSEAGAAELPDVDSKLEPHNKLMMKVAWWLTKIDFENADSVEAKSDSDSDSDGASNKSFLLDLDFTPSDDDFYFPSGRNDPRNKEHKGLIEELCGRTLTLSKYRYGKGEEDFKNIFTLRPGSSYDKGNIQANCNLCATLVVGKQQLADHVLSQKHIDKMEEAGLDENQKKDPAFRKEMEEKNKKAASALKINKDKTKSRASDSDDKKSPSSRDKEKQKDSSSSRSRPRDDKEKREDGKNDKKNGTNDDRGRKSKDDDKGVKRSRSKGGSRSPRHKRGRSRSPRRRSRSPRKGQEHKRSRSPSSPVKVERIPRSPTKLRDQQQKDRDKERERERQKLRPRSTSAERVKKFLEKTNRRSRSPSRSRKRHRRSRSKSPLGGILMPRRDNKEFNEKLMLTAEGKWTDEMEQKWKLMEAEQAIFMEQYSERGKCFNSSPEKHPNYGTEWTAFWEKRYKQIDEEGGDADNYNYVPEWKEFWTKKLRELLEIEYDREIKAIKERHGMDLESLHKVRMAKVPKKVAPPPKIGAIVPAPVPPPPPQINQLPIFNSPSPVAECTPSTPSSVSMAGPPSIHSNPTAIAQAPASILSNKSNKNKDDYQARSMSISDCGSVKSSNGAGNASSVPSCDDIMSTWKKLTRSDSQSGTNDPVPPTLQVQAPLSFSKSKSVEEMSNADSGSIASVDFNGFDVTQVLHLVSSLEDQLSFFADKVKEYYKKSEEMELTKKNKSSRLLEEEDFVFLLFNVRDRFMAQIRANVLPKDILHKLNCAVYGLDALIKSPQCETHRSKYHALAAKEKPPAPTEKPPTATEEKRKPKPVQHTGPSSSSQTEKVAAAAAEFLMTMGWENLSDTELRDFVRKIVPNGGISAGPTSKSNPPMMNRDQPSLTDERNMWGNMEPPKKATKTHSVVTAAVVGRVAPPLPVVRAAPPPPPTPAHDRGPLACREAVWESDPDRRGSASSESERERGSPFSRRGFSGNPLSTRYPDKGRAKGSAYGIGIRIIDDVGPTVMNSKGFPVHMGRNRRKDDEIRMNQVISNAASRLDPTDKPEDDSGTRPNRIQLGIMNLIMKDKNAKMGEKNFSEGELPSSDENDEINGRSRRKRKIRKRSRRKFQPRYQHDASSSDEERRRSKSGKRGSRSKSRKRYSSGTSSTYSKSIRYSRKRRRRSERAMSPPPNRASWDRPERNFEGRSSRYSDNRGSFSEVSSISLTGQESKIRTKVDQEDFIQEAEAERPPRQRRNVLNSANWDNVSEISSCNSRYSRATKASATSSHKMQASGSKEKVQSVSKTFWTEGHQENDEEKPPSVVTISSTEPHKEDINELPRFKKLQRQLRGSQDLDQDNQVKEPGEITDDSSSSLESVE